MTSSSGSSIVVLDENTATQEFISQTVRKRISDILSKVEKEVVIFLSVGTFREKIKYNPFLYIPRMLSYQDNKIVWEKIVPLNNGFLTQRFLTDNFLKIWYDICKGLLSLKKIGIIHNDTVLDNIGINGPNFCIYDFDGSGTPEEKGKDFSVDYISLMNSFSFYGLPQVKIEGINSLIIYVAKKDNMTFREAYEKLEKLEIVTEIDMHL